MYPLVFSLFYSIRLKNILTHHKSKFVSEYKVGLLMKTNVMKKMMKLLMKKMCIPLPLACFTKKFQKNFKKFSVTWPGTAKYSTHLVFIYPVHGRHSIIHRAKQMSFLSGIIVKSLTYPPVSCRPVEQSKLFSTPASGRQFGGEGDGGYTYPWPPYLKGYTYY